MDLPGGEMYQDVSDLFETASVEMYSGEMLWTEGFSLQDAMSALEIGEPRLDSGMVSEKDKRPPFDPLAPLLPQEVCWIIDRSFAYEMEWHAGNMLAHTVFTLVYVHELAQIDPEVVAYHFPTSTDAARPITLISVVLRTYIVGLLKCCGVSWDSLHRSLLHDGEDWQADKCEVSLLEGYPVNYAIAKLDETLQWMSRSNMYLPPWKDALHARLRLRRLLLELMNINIFDHLKQFYDMIAEVRTLLSYLRNSPAPEPDNNSPARLAFDPYIARRLVTFIPIRVLTLPPIDKTWDALDRFLDGWLEMAQLSVSRSLLTWEIRGNLRIWQQVECPAYILSRTQAVFHDGLLVLGRFSSSWLTHAFFSETLGASQERIFQIIQSGWTGSFPPPLGLIERTIAKVLIPTISGNWCNGPRRRRQLMKLVYEWHVLYDIFITVLENVDERRPEEHALFNSIPSAVLVWRLSALQELILSGFQLELYAPFERPFAYWYTAHIIEQHLLAIDKVSGSLLQDSASEKEMAFRRQFLTALQLLCSAMYSVLAPSHPFDWPEMKPNFVRRHKWMFNAKYKDITAIPVGHPELFRFLTAPEELLNDPFFSPAASCKLAYEILNGLVQSDNTGGWAGFCASDRKQFVKTLRVAAENLSIHLPSSMREVSTAFDWKRTLRWDPAVNPWFPLVR